MPSDHLIPRHPLLLLPSIFPSNRVFWVSSSHQVAKVLELQLQHQPFQWIFRTDFLYYWLVWSWSARDSQKTSSTPQLKSINSSALSILYSPTLTSKCLTLRHFLSLISSLLVGISVQFSSVTQSCPTLCNPMNRSMPGLPVHHQFPDFTQTHIHRVGDAIQPSYPLSSPSPPAPNPSQHQSLFQWVNSSHEVAQVLEFQL